MAIVDKPVDPASLAIPAPFVNSFQVLFTGTTIRVAFAERVAGEPFNYRSAIVMGHADAKQLADALLASLERAAATFAVKTPPTTKAPG
jgi:hypothetical protein